MVRAFRPEPVPPSTVTALIALSRRAPSAGNSQGTDFLVLEGPEQTAQFWDVTLPIERRQGFAWPQLLDAPVLVIPVGDSTRYTDRYAEGDKAHTALGETPAAWQMPYWHIDTAMATMTLLHATVDAGLGALFFGLFANTEAVKATFGVPAHADPIGAVAIGWPDETADRPSQSAKRPRRRVEEIIHRGRW